MDIHLINSKGKKKVISSSEWAKIQKEDNEDCFFHDIAWYLANGYILSSELKNRMRQVISYGNENNLYHMASIGYFIASKDNTKFDYIKFHVYVTESEQQEPHIHICDDMTNGKNFHTCICLTKIEYYNNAENNDILTPELKECLMRFLKSDCTKNRRYKTNWEYALSMWNDNNENLPQVDEDLDILDYTLL